MAQHWTLFRHFLCDPPLNSIFEVPKTVRSTMLVYFSSEATSCVFKGILDDGISETRGIMVWGEAKLKGLMLFSWCSGISCQSNISQNGNLPQIGVKIKHVWNHHLEIRCFAKDLGYQYVSETYFVNVSLKMLIAYFFFRCFMFERW